MKRKDLNKIKIAVLIASYNRCLCTIRSLKNLEKAKEDYFNIDIYLVDSNSTDNTVKKVRENFPSVKIKIVDSDIYWNKAMNFAWDQSFQENKAYDFFLWLNNDTYLYKNSLKIILDDYKKVSSESIIVGTTQYNKKLTYGGRKKLSSEIMSPNETPQEVKFINGNCVLIPKIVFENIGLLDDKFSHSLGDIDYGLRAIEEGITLYISSKIIGDCEKDNKPWFKDKRFKQRIINLNSPKGVPLNEYFYFNRRHFGNIKAVKFIIATFIALISPSFFQLIRSK